MVRGERPAPSIFVVLGSIRDTAEIRLTPNNQKLTTVSSIGTCFDDVLKLNIRIFLREVPPSWFLIWEARCDGQQSLDFGEEIEVVVTPFSSWLAKLMNNDEDLQSMHLMTALLAERFLARTDDPGWRTIRSEIKEIVYGELC